jgi:D-alanyl-D-alanine carboxypeptidase
VQKRYSQIDRRYNQQYSINKKPFLAVTAVAVVAVLVLLIVAVACARKDYKDSLGVLTDQSSDVIIDSSDVSTGESDDVSSGSSIGTTSAASSKVPSSTSSSSTASSSNSKYTVLNFVGQVDDWRLLLANRLNKVENYEPETKYIGSQYCQGSDNYQIDARVYDDLIEMINAASDDGVKLVALSAYRSYSRQTTLYNNKVNYFLKQGYSQKAAEEKAATIVAIPGTSDHNLGLAIDFNYLEDKYENTKPLKWLRNNAEKYGFVMRYPKDKESVTGVIYEPWHYRYVGRENAAEMNSKNMCLEEYVQYLSK